MKKVLVLASILYSLTHTQQVQGCARYITNPNGQRQCRFCEIPLFLVDGQCLQCPHGQKFAVNTCIEIQDIQQSLSEKPEKVEQHPEILRCLQYSDEIRSQCNKCQDGYKVEKQTSKKCVADDRTVFCRLYSQFNKNCMLCDNEYVLNEDNICEQKQTADQKLKISNDISIIQKQKQESSNQKKSSDQQIDNEQIGLSKPIIQEAKLSENNNNQSEKQKTSQNEKKDPQIDSSESRVDPAPQQNGNESQKQQNSEKTDNAETAFEDFFDSTFELLMPVQQETTTEEKDPKNGQGQESVFEDFFDSTFEVFTPLSEQTVIGENTKKPGDGQNKVTQKGQQRMHSFSPQNNEPQNDFKELQEDIPEQSKKDIPKFPKFPSFPESPQEAQENSSFNLRKVQLSGQATAETTNSEPKQIQNESKSSGQQKNQQSTDKSQQQSQNISNDQFSLISSQIKEPNQQTQKPNQQIQDSNEPQINIQNSFSFNNDFGEEFTFESSSDKPKLTIKPESDPIDNKGTQEEVSVNLIHTNLNENKQPGSSDNEQETVEQAPVIHLYPQFPFCVDFFEGQCYACDPAFVLDLIRNQCVRLKQDPRGKAKILLPSQNQEDFCNVRDEQTGECSECFRNHYYNKQKKKCIEFNRLCRSVDEENGNCLSCYNNYELFRGDCRQIDA